MGAAWCLERVRQRRSARGPDPASDRALDRREKRSANISDLCLKTRGRRDLPWSTFRNCDRRQEGRRVRRNALEADQVLEGSAVSAWRALLALPACAGAGRTHPRRHRLQPEHDLGDRRRRARDVHAGRLRVARDRLLAEKNAGTGVAKILTNFSIASICYWAVGFALAFGGAGTIAGDSRVLPRRQLGSGGGGGSSSRSSRPTASARRRSCSSSSCSARSRWRSCGARRWSGSSSAPT